MVSNQNILKGKFKSIAKFQKQIIADEAVQKMNIKLEYWVDPNTGQTHEHKTVTYQANIG